MNSEIKLSRRRVLAVGSAFAATAVLAACGEADEDTDDSGGGGQSGPTSTPSSSPTETPGSATPVFATEGAEPVVSVAYEGGFLPVEDMVRRAPVISLYNDGQLIYPGPIPEIYPQPATPNVLVTKLSESGLEAVAQKIGDTGLFEDGDLSFETKVESVVIAATTVFTVRLAGQEPVRVSAYGLESSAEPTNMPDEEIEARRKLRELFNYIAGAPTVFPTDHIAEQEAQYGLDRLQIVTYPWDEVGVDFEEPPVPLEWPLDEAPSTIGEVFNLPGHNARCAVLEGDDVDLMMDALSNANVWSRWERLGEHSALIVRPLLPGEEGCQNEFKVSDPPRAGEEIEHPTGDDELVLRYEMTGGFVPLEWLVTNMPTASLYGTGRIITEGAQIAIFPPPALPALELARLNEDGIQLLLAEADAAGLLQGEQTWDELTQYVADAGTGVLTINAGGETHKISVYAPGMFDIGDLVSDEEVEFRMKFDAFVSKLPNLSGWLPEDVFLDVEDDYPADRLQLVSQPASVRSADDVEPNEIEWPLDAPLSDLGDPYSLLELARCFVLEGQEFADVMSLMNDATSITRWISEGEQYILHARPLLPDEEGCQHPFE